MNLVINSQFRPFTYDEMVKPLVQYKEVYDKIEQDYSDLVTQTEAWKNIAERDKSPMAYGMYQRYSNDLAAITEDFSRGMNLNNRRALLGMKKRYAQDITPIANAYTRKEALAEEQRKAELNNPTMLWQRRANDMSLDDFINDPSIDYGGSASGTVLSAQVAAGATALAKEFRDNPERMKALVGGDYFEYIKERGFSSEAVLAAIMDNPNASHILKQLVESTIDASGIKGWDNETALQQAYNYARQGLWNAVGQDESQLVQNWRAQENLSHSHAMARQHDSQKFQSEEAEKERNFKREMTSLRPMLGDDEKPNGRYYDPSLGVITDKDGNVYPNDAGGFKPPTGSSNNKKEKPTVMNPDGTVKSIVGSYTDNSDTSSLVMNNNGIKASDFAGKGWNIKDITSKGFRVATVIVHMGDGKYQYAAPGKDLGNNNMTLALNNVGLPQLDSKGNYILTQGESKYPFGMTSKSNVVSNAGNLIRNAPDNGKKLTLVSEADLSELAKSKKPEDIRLYHTLRASVKGKTNSASNNYYAVFKVEDDDGNYSYVTFTPI